MTECHIKTISGSINTVSAGTAKANFFHCNRSGGAAGTGNELFMDKSATDTSHTLVKRSGGAQFSEAIPGTPPAIGGRRITQGFAVKEGEILKAFVNVKGRYGKIPRSASMFLRVRAGAAFRRIKFKMIDAEEGDFEYAEIEGTFDLITTEEALALGVHIPTAYRSFSDPSNIATILDSDTIIREETIARVVLEEKEVSAGDGPVKIIRKRRKRRLLE